MVRICGERKGRSALPDLKEIHRRPVNNQKTSTSDSLEVRATLLESIKMTKPWWSEENLQAHWAKRQRENPGCWRDLLATDGESIDGYRERGHDTPEKGRHWLAYEAVQKKSEVRWYPRSRYYIDSHLVKVIVVDKDDEISSCYHVHWRSFDHDAVMDWEVGERKDRFRKKLAGELLAGKIDEHGVKEIFDEEN